jgi:hypothetical protein
MLVAVLVCPNKQCPFALRQGHPAEYRETFVTCSDCGATLVHATKAEPPPRAPPAVGAPLGPVLVTAAMFALVVSASFVPMVQERGGGSLMSLRPQSWMSLTTFGLNPFISSFLIVELVALIPALNVRRVGTFSQRAPLRLAAILLGVLLLAIQSFSMLKYLQSSTSVMTGSLDSSPAEAVAALAIVALMVFGASVVVDRWGIGSGFAVVLAALTSGELYALTKNLGRALGNEIVTPVTLPLVLGLFIAAAVIAVKLTRVPRTAGASPSWVPIPVSTLQPMSAAAALLSLPATLGLRLARDLQSSPVVYNAISAVVIAALAIPLGLLFFRPSQVEKMWKQWRPGSDAKAEAWSKARLPRALAQAAAVCIALPLISNLFSFWLLVPSIGTGMLAIIPLSLIATDVIEEALARHRLGPLIAVRPVWRFAELEPVLATLAAANIPAFPRSGHYRVLLGFFAPYAPLTLLVPAAKAEEARQLIDR